MNESVLKYQLLPNLTNNFNTQSTVNFIPVVLHEFLEVEEEVLEKRGALFLKEVLGCNHNWNDVLNHIALYNLQEGPRINVATW